MLLPLAVELGRHFRNLELKFLRGTALDVAGFLKRGDAELAIAAPIGEEWERFDSWPLFSERFGVIAYAAHPIAGRSQIDVHEIRNERLLVRGYCEQAGELAELMRGHDIDVTRGHEVASERDLIALVEANPAAYREVSHLNALSAKTWNTPALAGEFLLVRNDQEAACYRLPRRVTRSAGL